MSYACILNAKITVLIEKDFGCGKCLWQDAQKESFMFLLRNQSYLIMRSWYWQQIKEHVWFFTAIFGNICFLIGCNSQSHWLIILLNNFSAWDLIFFQLQNGTNIFITGKRNYCVLSRCAKVENFSVNGNISEVDSGL